MTIWRFRLEQQQLLPHYEHTQPTYTLQRAYLHPDSKDCVDTFEQQRTSPCFLHGSVVMKHVRSLADHSFYSHSAIGCTKANVNNTNGCIKYACGVLRFLLLDGVWVSWKLKYVQVYKVTNNLDRTHVSANRRLRFGSDISRQGAGALNHSSHAYDAHAAAKTVTARKYSFTQHRNAEWSCIARRSFAL